MATPPPQYPIHDGPPPYLGHVPYPMRPPRIPGLTLTAFIMMWVLFAGSVWTVINAVTLLVTDPSAYSEAYPVMAEWAPLLQTAIGAQALAWAIMRGILAMRIYRRSATARTYAIALEAVGLVFQCALGAVLVSAIDFARPTGFIYINFDCVAIVLPILVMCFLSSHKSKWWCDR
ncbi:hypothetical protein AB0B28_02030 [Glycomyces sp. NPDC046736]|uniref:hypothetical protein n=1 Tax=Glycomyces sp. NPDC046736 TaxID=3155615 RepID=UPI0033E2C3E4